METKIGKEFLSIIEKHFPPGHKWHPHFNKHTIKLSYSCTKNLAAHITSHNMKLLRGPEVEAGCNCQNKGNCPLAGKCLTKALVYQATIKTNDNSPDYAYYGSTANSFKERYNGHLYNLRHPDKPGTALSSKAHELEASQPPVQYQIKWSEVDKCYPLRPGYPICDVCNTEKTRILLKHKGPPPTLPKNCQVQNIRKELFAKCRHKAKFMLKNCDKLY